MNALGFTSKSWRECLIYFHHFFPIRNQKKIGKYAEVYMYNVRKVRKPQNYFANLSYRIVLQTAYLGVSLGSVMLDCNVIVLVRLD